MGLIPPSPEALPIPSKKKFCKTAKNTEADRLWARVLTQTTVRGLSLSGHIVTWLSTLQTLLHREVSGTDSTGESPDIRHTPIGTEGLVPFPMS